MALIQISSFSMSKSRVRLLEIIAIFVVGVWFFTSFFEGVFFSDDDGGSDKSIYHRLFENSQQVKGRRNFTCYLNDDPSSQELFPVHLLKERRCEQRLPNVLIAGVKYCRTNILTSLLRHHPYLVFPKLSADVSYFGDYYDLGIKWYQRQMGFSIQEQLTVDVSPSYFTDVASPGRIRSELSNTTKIVILFCDPVDRALREIRDLRRDQFELLSDMEVEAQEADDPFLRNDEQYDSALQEVFEGGSNSSLNVVSNGVYLNFFREWYKHFPPDTFFMLGEGRLLNDTEEVLTKLERFLQVPSHFTSKVFRDPFQDVICLRSDFKFDPYCFSRGDFVTEQNTTRLKKLREYYRPFNEKLQKLFLVPVL